MSQLAQAEVRARRIRKAGGVAMFNGWTIGVFAGFAGLSTLVSPLCGRFDFTGLVITVGLSLVAWTEFKGRRLLRQFDLRGPRLLGWNQVCLLVLIIGYCVWMTATAYVDPQSEIARILAQVKMLGLRGPMKKLVEMFPVIFYGAVALVSIVFQGLNAVYYFTRAKLIRAYLNETPPWVVEIQRHSAGA